MSTVGGRAITDIPKAHRELVRLASDHVVAFQVGFVRLIGDEDDAEVAGSGTLIRISGDRPTILTASHVIDALSKQGRIGLMLRASRTPPLERFFIDADKVQMLTIGSASHTADGPDLAVVVLPEATASDIASRGKAFYNLGTRCSRMLEPSPRPELGFWGSCGVVHEWTKDLPQERTFSRVKAFRNIFGAGEVSNRVMRGAFDYLTFEARVGSNYEGPDNYQGVSGGAGRDVRTRQRVRKTW